MKVLVTGINGFVGQHMFRELISRNIDVWGLDIESCSEKVKAVNLLDKNLLESVVKEISPDYVIHLAAIASVDHANISLIYDINFKGALNLLSACNKLNEKPGFIFVSSSQVYGNVSETVLPIDESFIVNPVNHYGASKAAGESAVKAFGAEYAIPYVIARPFNHTGPGQTDKFVVPKIVNEFRKRSESIELGNIDTIRDFTDVRDIVKAYCCIIENFKDGEVYNIASGTGISIREMFQLIREITGHDMEVIKKEYLVRDNEIKAIVGNSERIKRDTGWAKEFTIEDTLRDMLCC
jgi:nucleoside-diphosphate-sugar epimerase